MVVDAAAGLLEEGHLRPTAARVAERAGVSVRSVFQHFTDLEELFVAVAGARTATIESLFASARYDGDLPARLDTFLRYRSALYESVAPIRRAATLRQPVSPVVAAQLELARTLHGVDVARAFEPELDLARRRGDKDFYDALCAATSFAFWEELRRHRGLGVEQARAACRRVLAALLNDAGSH